MERDRGKRQALMHQIQRLMHERVMYAPVFEPATLHGVGPRVAEAAVGLNPQLYFAAPYEDMRLKNPEPSPCSHTSGAAAIPPMALPDTAVYTSSTYTPLKTPGLRRGRWRRYGLETSP